MTARLILTASLAALAVSACQTGPAPYRPTITTTADLHKPVVTEEVARLDLLPPRGGVAPGDRPALASFLREYREAGHGPLVVAAPPGENPAPLADEVRAVAAGIGMAPPPVALATSVDDGGSPYNLTFVRYRAHIEECGQEWPSLSQTARSQTYSNFGCAHNANLAAMIADPADLVAPREMTPADAQRRQTVLQAYRAGETTGAERSDSDSAAVAGVE